MINRYQQKQFAQIIKEFILVLFSIVLLTANFSCKKFLEEKPDDKITTPTTVKDLQAMLDNSDRMNIKNPSYDEASADDYFLTKENYARLGVRAQAAYIWEFDPNLHPNDWSRASETIYISNACLDIADKLIKEGTSTEELNNVRGSALFYRAFTWLHQLWIHSNTYDQASSKTDLGIVIRKTADFNVASIRASTEEGYLQIISDLQQAIELLPNTQTPVLRPSKAAAYALLARTYLSMRQYESALVNAEKSLAIKSDLIDYNTVNTTIYSPFQSYNPEVLFHAEISAFSYFNIQPAYGMVDTVLYQSYNQNDLRKGIFFLSNGKYFSFKGPYLSRATGSNNLFTGIATDEVYLIKAECLARTGKIDEAMATLNTLMKKRWKSTVTFPSFTAQTKEQALATILNERRKEILFRGLRWMDIKRLNKEGNQIEVKRILNGTIYKLEPNSYKYALPIPSDIVAFGIPQSPGW